MIIENTFTRYNLFALFSKYRKELMGVAILEVILGHTMSLSEVFYTPVLKFLSILTRFVFTEGFLFLSGLGVYYSFSKNNSKTRFYKRRLLRLFIPYVLLTSWFFLYTDILREGDFLGFVGHISTFAFWFEGNFVGMWYVAISLLLYFLYPIIHFCLYTYSVSYFKFVLLLFFLIVFNLGMSIYVPNYYEGISIGVGKIPCFIIGSLCGYYSEKDRVNLYGIGIVYTLICIIYASTYHFSRDYIILSQWSSILEKFLGMTFCALLLSFFAYCHKVQPIYRCLRWFGSYTLELYILHLLIFTILGYEEIFGLVPMSYRIVIMCLLAFLLCKPIHYAIDMVIKKYF